MASAVRSSEPAAKITVHWLEASRATRILWLLEELQRPYELKTYKRQRSKQADPKLKEVHPLGKSPVLEIESPATAKPLVLAESGAIIEYLLDHYGKLLIPKRYRDGMEDQVGGETESWLRYRMYMHYAEGSIMPLNLLSLLVQYIKDAPVPFFIRPITNNIASRIQTSFLHDQFKLHYQFIEDQLASSPDGGQFLCGRELSGADILMSFPLEAGTARSGLKQESFPKVFAYVSSLYERPAYKRARERIIEVEGQFKTSL